MSKRSGSYIATEVIVYALLAVVFEQVELINPIWQVLLFAVFVVAILLTLFGQNGENK